jgi:hypothetical protein
VSLFSEDTFKELVRNGMGIDTLPVQSAVLFSAFGHTTTRINRQMLVSELNGGEFENNFPDCWQMMSAITLGSDFLFT